MSIGARALQLCLAVVTLCLFSSPSVAATVNATSCTSSAVQSAINAASTGDTVQVPAGTCTYSTSVNIPNGKHVTIQGAGINVTTISANGETVVLNLNGSATRVTGFTFNQGQILIGGDNATPVQDWRIDHNRFVGANYNGYTSVLINCPFATSPTGTFCRGLVDNNTFEAGAVAVPFGFAAQSSLHAARALPTNLGGADTIFIEDNTFTSPTGALWHFIDTNYSGKFVFRFNTTREMGAEAHSLQAWRGSRSWEIYKNTNTGGGWTAGLLRGGVGVAWGNQYDSTRGPWVIDNVRSWISAGYHYGDCDGTSTADGNTTGQQGWPCRDQIGRGPDIGLSNPSDFTPNATGWSAQTWEPAYFFLNRTGGSITAIDTSGRGRSTLHVLPNRDFYNEVSSFNGTSGVGSGPIANRPATCTTRVAYWATDQGSWNLQKPANTSGQLYKCTATNTWSLYYVPYAYPHPLTQGGAIPPAPTNLIVR